MEGNTSVSLDAVGQVGGSGERGGVDEGKGGEGELGAAGVAGDDVFLAGPHERAGQPGGVVGSVVFCGSDDDG